MFVLLSDLVRRFANFAVGRDRSPAEIAFGVRDASAYDDMSAIRCLRETYPERLSACDGAGFYGPDGRLIWEQGVDAHD